jgi:hypothetical protein
MAAKNARKSTPQPARAPQARQAITLELVAQLAPTAVQAEKISAAFAFDPVEFDSIREATEEQIGLIDLTRPAAGHQRRGCFPPASVAGRSSAPHMTTP